MSVTHIGGTGNQGHVFRSSPDPAPAPRGPVLAQGAAPLPTPSRSVVGPGGVVKFVSDEGTSVRDDGRVAPVATPSKQIIGPGGVMRFVSDDGAPPPPQSAPAPQAAAAESRAIGGAQVRQRAIEQLVVAFSDDVVRGVLALVEERLDLPSDGMQDELDRMAAERDLAQAEQERLRRELNARQATVDLRSAATHDPVVERAAADTLVGVIAADLALLRESANLLAPGAMRFVAQLDVVVAGQRDIQSRLSVIEIQLANLIVQAEGSAGPTSGATVLPFPPPVQAASGDAAPAVTPTRDETPAPVGE